MVDDRHASVTSASDTLVPDGFLDPPTPDMVGQVLADAASEIPVGQRFGPYRVTGFIASGGMGAVYEAVRDDGQFDKKVAVKILHRPFARPGEPDVIAREQQILAKLEHHGIARLLDAGVTEFGFAYLIMEFVDGQPIHAYCGERSLSVRDRLLLFLKVCEAVRYAHQRLILHRDLKPANILVTADGQPKIVDFGIAKIVDDAVVGDPQETLRHAGTPRYAAPETYRGEPATTATDVYALGVILYEILAESSPYRMDGLTAGEAEHVVCHVEPRLPSEAATDAVRRSALKGDLDTIVLQAMHKDSSRRYASVEQLAEDIDRHLNHYPVKARPDSAMYRAQRFVTRRKGLVVLLVLVFSMPVIGILISSFGFIAAKRAERQAVRDAVRAQQMTAFLSETLAEADPLKTQRPDVMLPKMLAQASSRIESEFRDDPATQAMLHRTMGRSYLRLGKLPESREQLERSVALLRGMGSAPPAELSQSLEVLAEMQNADGQHEDAYALLREALAIRESVGGLELAPTLIQLAQTAVELEAFEEAANYQRRSIELLRDRPNADAISVADAMHGLADIELRSGRADAALNLQREALTFEVEQLGADHAMTGMGHHRLARLLIKTDAFAEADKHLATAIDILAAAVPEEPTRQITPVLDRAHLQEKLSKPDDADALYQRAIAMTAALPPDHWVYAVTRHRYVGFLIDQGRLAEALPLAESVADALASMLGEEHDRTIEARQRVATLRENIDAATAQP